MRYSFLCVAAISTVLLAAEPPAHSVKPRNGLVPDAATATKIAVAVWEPIYGARQIADQQPYRAKLRNGIWTVEGTLNMEMGGVALAEISQKDGRIVRVSHGR